jgi:sirohydrochlorin ferrochelatase
MTAILLIAHGSRRAEANADLDWLADQLAGAAPIIRTSYLELAEPTIAAGGDSCVAAGASRVIMLPYFLAPGVHVREDLLTARDELATRYTSVEFLIAAPLGRHPLLAEIVRERIAEAIPNLT